MKSSWLCFFISSSIVLLVIWLASPFLSMRHSSEQWAYIFICPCLPLLVKSISRQAEIIAIQSVLLIPNGSMGESALIPNNVLFHQLCQRKHHIYYSLCNYIMISRIHWLILLISSFYDYILPFTRQTKVFANKVYWLPQKIHGWPYWVELHDLPNSVLSLKQWLIFWKYMVVSHNIKHRTTLILKTSQVPLILLQIYHPSN